MTDHDTAANIARLTGQVATLQAALTASESQIACRNELHAALRKSDAQRNELQAMLTACEERETQQRERAKKAAGEAWAEMEAKAKRSDQLESVLRAIIGSRHDDLDTGLLNWVAVLDCALDKATALLAAKPRSAIYTASRTRHARRWQELRAAGVPVISTWIDEAGEGESASLVDLWIRCATEAASATAVLLYAEEGDVLKGAFVEAGVALASGVPVFVVGPVPGSWVNHPLVTKCESIDEALAAVDARRGGGQPQPCQWCKPPGSGKDSCEASGRCMSCNGTGRGDS